MSLAKTELRAKNSGIRNLLKKVPVVEVRQLGYVDLGNKVEGKEKGPWSTGERPRLRVLREEGVEKGKATAGSFVLKVLRTGNLGEVSGQEKSQQTLHLIGFSGVSFQGPGLY